MNVPWTRYWRPLPSTDDLTMTFHGPHPRSDKKLYSAKEAATCLGISTSHLYRLVSRGEVASTRSGSRRLFRPEDLDRWVQGLPMESDGSGGAA